MRRKLTAKQIAAGFGGKRRRKAARSKRVARRASPPRKLKRTKKVRHMARHHKKHRSHRRSKLPIGLALPGIKIAASAILGRPGQYYSLIQDMQRLGPAKGALSIVDKVSAEMGYYPALSGTNGANAYWTTDKLTENLTLGAIGYVGHKLATRSGLNRQLNRMGAPVVI